MFSLSKRCRRMPLQIMTPLIPPESDSDLRGWPARNLAQQLFQIELAKMCPGNRLRIMFGVEPLLEESGVMNDRPSAPESASLTHLLDWK